MRTLALGSEELGAALRVRTKNRVTEVLSGSECSWYPKGLTFPLGTDRNDRPRHICEEERTITGLALVFPVIFFDVGKSCNRGPDSIFSPYWIKWMAIHDWMLPPDHRVWRIATVMEAISALAQTLEVGSLRCDDADSWFEPSGQVYIRNNRVVFSTNGSSAFHHLMYVQRALCPYPPTELQRF